MEAHIPGSTDAVERRFVKLQSKTIGSGNSNLDEANSAVFLLHHPLEQNFRVLFLVSLCAAHLPFGSSKGIYSI